MHRRSYSFTSSIIFALGLFATGATAADVPNSGLRIALTNDDGWSAPGVQALYTELTKQGHQVTLVGSATQQSGSSAAIDGGPVTLTKHAERQYSAAASTGASGGAKAAGAEPLSCGMLAIAIAGQLDGQPSQLLLSGINSGANIGAAALHSGTVGAVIGAISAGIEPQLPGIAISTDEPKCDDACIEAHYANVAQYTAGVIEALAQQSGGQSLLPPGLGLNINYPPLPTTKIRGARLTTQSTELAFGGNRARLKFECLACAAINIGETATTSGIGGGPGQPANAVDDVGLFINGNITLVPIRADYSAWPTAKRNRRAMRALRTTLGRTWPIAVQ